MGPDATDAPSVRRIVEHYAVEVSTGSGFEPGSSIFGVTVLTTEAERTDLSGCFPTLDEAEAFADALASHPVMGGQS